MNISQTIRGPGLGQSSATHPSARKRSFAGGLIFLSLSLIIVRGVPEPTAPSDVGTIMRIAIIGQWDFSSDVTFILPQGNGR